MEVNLNISKSWTDNDILNLKSKFSEMASQLDTLYVTNSPNGSIKSRIGAIALYKNGSSFEMWINIDGDTTWQKMASYSDIPQAFPVNSVFISIVSTNPNTLLGYGTWSQIAQGRMLIGQSSSDTDFDTAEETGGAKTHTLTIDEIPNHDHPIPIGTGPFSTGVTGGDSSVGGLNTGAVGGGQAHSIMNPFFVVYIWKRTA